MKISIAGKSLKKLWDDFLIKENGPLLQSYVWGEFQKNYGRKVFPLLISDTEMGYGKDNYLTSQSKTLAAALLIKHPLPGGKNYLFCPYGPQMARNLTGSKKKSVLKVIIKKAKELAGKENSSFLHFEPKENLGLGELGFVKSAEIEPKSTFIISLEGTDEEIMTRMKQKTRYNIRLSMRKGIRVKRVKEMADLDDFFEMIEKTEKNQKIELHPKDYYQVMFRSFSEEKMVDLLLAQSGGKIVAAIMVVYFGETAYYLHGGSNPEFKNLMAPYLLQWQGMLYAKDHGCQYYDFCGATEDLNHPWAGITRFKRGFDPKRKITNYPGAFDLPIKAFEYRMYRILKKMKSIF